MMREKNKFIKRPLKTKEMKGEIMIEMKNTKEMKKLKSMIDMKKMKDMNEMKEIIQNKKIQTIILATIIIIITIIIILTIEDLINIKISPRENILLILLKIIINTIQDQEINNMQMIEMIELKDQNTTIIKEISNRNINDLKEDVVLTQILTEIKEKATLNNLKICSEEIELRIVKREMKE